MGSNERYLKTIAAVRLITSGLYNSRFHDFPEDIARLVFETAALGVEGPTNYPPGKRSESPWGLALVSKKVKEWTEPLLYRTLYVVPCWREDLLGRTVQEHPSKPDNFFAVNVKHLIFEYSMLPSAIVFDIVKACTGVRSLTDYSAGVVYLGRMKQYSCTWTRNITHLELKLGVRRTPPLASIQSTVADMASLTHLRMGFIETTQPPYREIAPFVVDMVQVMPASLQVIGVTLFLHSSINQIDLAEVVQDIIKVDIRVVVALWPTGSVSDAVQRLSIVRSRSFQWHTNNEFWDEASEEVKGRKQGSRKWPEDPVERFDQALIKRWQSLSIHDWKGFADTE